MEKAINQDNNFGCHLFKSDVVSTLLYQIDERIDIMEKIADDLKRLEGINVIEMWRKLYSDIQNLWLKDGNSLIITLNKTEELKLRFLSDLVAQFFLYNGDETDNEFLKNVSEIFKDIKEKHGDMTTEQVWAELKLSIK